MRIGIDVDGTLTNLVGELLEAWQNPTQHLIGIVTLWNHGDFRSVSTQEPILRGGYARQHITIDDANALAGIVAVRKQRREFLAYKHVNVSRIRYLTTTEGNTTSQVYLTRVEQTSNEQHHSRIADGPNHFALVYRIDVVHLHANVTCRALAIENVDLYILDRKSVV